MGAAMSERTAISYATYSWSPFIGCEKVSPGCKHCYAYEMGERFNWKYFGPDAERKRTKDWRAPLRWNKDAAGLKQRPRVFPSLCDWLDPKVPVEWLADFLCLIRATPNLNWLLLTKRPHLFDSRVYGAMDWLKKHDTADNAKWVLDWISGLHVPDNVWNGFTAENQRMLIVRLAAFDELPATKVRWISYEPLLEPIIPPSDFPHWGICGGESGPNRRQPKGMECHQAIEALAEDLLEPGHNWVYVKQDIGKYPGRQGKISDRIWAYKQIPPL